MNNDTNNKAIKSIVIEGYKPCVIKSDNDKFLRLSTTYHGDRDEFWVVECQRYGSIEGKEIARYNTKYISNIVWE